MSEPTIPGTAATAGAVPDTAAAGAAALSDLEIAQQATMRPIEEIAAAAGINAEALDFHGRYKAKIDPAKLAGPTAGGPPRAPGKVVLVSAMSPTPAGEGKSTTTVGLADSLARAGHKVMIALREPSLGPILGMKGGATGGGYSQVLPMDEINLHFTGDFHAVTSANNALMALVDNHIYQGNELNIDPRRMTFKRVLDMNDRSLREVVIGLGGPTQGIPRQDGFDITVASEIMAVFCLATDLADLRERLGRITFGYTYDRQPVTVAELGVQGALTMLLKDAIKPNLVQTIAGTPALVHGGPFANIAHGCNSLIATQTARSLADIVVTEAGFGADLGAEKYMDIKSRVADVAPSAVVVVATVRALKMHGGIPKDRLKEPNLDALAAGVVNLQRHVRNVEKFGITPVVAINKFATDTREELDWLLEWCAGGGRPGGRGRRLGPRRAAATAATNSRPRLPRPSTRRTPSGTCTRWRCRWRTRSGRSCRRSTAPTAWISPSRRSSGSRRSRRTAGPASRSAWRRPSTPSATTPASSAPRRVSPCTSATSSPRPAPASSWPSPARS